MKTQQTEQRDTALAPIDDHATALVRIVELTACAQRLADALKRAKQDLIDIQKDSNNGEFEVDPQFAIDRVTEALAQWEADQ